MSKTSQLPGFYKFSVAERRALVCEATGVEPIEIEQRSRVHTDHPVDDELQAREADTGVRDASEIERAVRITDVHHDLHG